MGIAQRVRDDFAGSLSGRQEEEGKEELRKFSLWDSGNLGDPQTNVVTS